MLYSLIYINYSNHFNYLRYKTQTLRTKNILNLYLQTFNKETVFVTRNPIILLIDNLCLSLKFKGDA